jgi:hypothetical protein
MSAAAWLAVGVVAAGGWTALLVFASDIGGFAPVLTFPVK